MDWGWIFLCLLVMAGMYVIGYLVSYNYSKNKTLDKNKKGNENNAKEK